MVNEDVADLEAVNTAVEANPTPDKYDFSVLALILTAALLGTYLVFVYWSSFREYREVIEEKFGPSREDET